MLTVKNISTRNSTIKTPSQLDAMREAGYIVAVALDKVFKIIEPGITTQELDSIARCEIELHNARPAFLGLYGFPATACISLNEEIVHGIPGKRVIKAGDLVSIDCGAVVDSMYSDMARSIVVSPSKAATPTAEKLKICQVTRESLKIGIEQVRSGKRTGDIGHAVEKYAQSHGYDVVREYVGHGIGEKLHELPQIPNFGKPNTGSLLSIGMTIAIEPMLVEGDYRTSLLEDTWTVVTRDGKLSAHFEDTVAVTERGFEILTTVNKKAK